MKNLFLKVGERSIIYLPHIERLKKLENLLAFLFRHFLFLNHYSGIFKLIFSLGFTKPFTSELGSSFNVYINGICRPSCTRLLSLNVYGTKRNDY